MASSFYGILRVTQGIDFVADLSPESVSSFVQKLKKLYYLNEETIQRAIMQRGSFNIIHLESIFEVNIFLLKETPLARRKMDRRKRVILDEEREVYLYLCSPEDMILEKLFECEKGSREGELQKKDVLGILKIQGDLIDRDYLKETAEELGIGELWREISGA